MAAAARSVTKSGLSLFLRDNSPLNLTQAKALTTTLLERFIITAKPPAGPTTVPIEAGQTWVYSLTGRTMLVTQVELGPLFVPDDPVTTWGPVRVHWEGETESGIAEIGPWLEHMRLQTRERAAEATANLSPAPPSPESESAS